MCDASTGYRIGGIEAHFGRHLRLLVGRRRRRGGRELRGHVELAEAHAAELVERALVRLLLEQRRHVIDLCTASAFKTCSNSARTSRKTKLALRAVCKYEVDVTRMGKDHIDTAIDEHELQRGGDRRRARGVVDGRRLQRLVQPLLAVQQFAQHLNVRVALAGDGAPLGTITAASFDSTPMLVHVR